MLVSIFVVLRDLLHIEVTCLGLLVLDFLMVIMFRMMSMVK